MQDQAFVDPYHYLKSVQTKTNARQARTIAMWVQPAARSVLDRVLLSVLCLIRAYLDGGKGSLEPLWADKLS